jgi:tetratricopeptide (TPR) repeat protein
VTDGPTSEEIHLATERAIDLYRRGEHDSAQHATEALAARAITTGDSAGLSRLLTLQGQIAYRRGNLKQARHLGEEALALKIRIGLESELAVSYNALGLIAWLQYRLDAALHFYQRADETATRGRLARSRITGAINRGLVYADLGRFPDAIEAFSTGLELARTGGEGRLEANAATNLGMVRLWAGEPLAAIPHLEHGLRHAQETEALFDQALALDPTYGAALRDRADTFLSRDGDVGEWVRVDQRRSHIGPYYRRDWPALIADVEAWQEAVRLTDRYADPGGFYIGLAQQNMSDGTSAAEALRVAVDSLEARLSHDPGDFRYAQALGVVYAALGQRNDALQAGRQGLELMPPERDALYGPWAYTRLAQIHALLGQADSAVAYLEEGLSKPGPLGGWDIRADPIYDGIRDHPRFQALLEKHGTQN